MVSSKRLDPAVSMDGSTLPRRAFLRFVSSVGAVAAFRFLPGEVLLARQALSKERLTARSMNPEDFETPAHLLTSWITPNDLFFVRSHFYTPSLSGEGWNLRVDGEVNSPLTLTLDDLRRLPSHTTVVTLECAGNGRAFFEPPVAGIQWEKGAVGTARWTGVRLADVLRRAGVRPSGRYVWLDGADRGIGRAPDFVRHVPMQKAMHLETLLAYEMNGQPLPVPHGLPLRAIVPGWEGAYSVKWLTHIQVSDREYDGPFVQSGYRYPRRPVQPGTLVATADTEPLQALPVKSLITSPANGANVRVGPVSISGFAWAGEAAIRRVDVSTDGGRTWTQARLGPDRAAYAWRQFEHTWRPTEAGSFIVLSRASDDDGRVQPIIPDWNPAGYLWNAVDQARLNVVAR